MKDIYYGLATFHKAVKRNKPSIVYYNWLDFWFFTQKACINFTADNKKQEGFLIKWLNNLNIEVEFHEC